MVNAFHIQSDQGRINAINRFCYITAAMSSVYIFILYFIGFPFQAFVMLLVAAAFVLCAVLTKKSFHALSRILIVLLTNFSVFYFSILFGFNAGIHLYLFTAPLIAYLLFDFRQRKKIILTFSLYLLNFFAIFSIHRFNIFQSIELTETIADLFYVINFSFGLILCFTLIFYFAFNNNAHTGMVIEVNKSLQEKHIALQQEISKKNKAHAELVKALKEKEILLSEIHHRVKNNLAVISGLVELQNFYVKDEKASAILKESRNRIKSIAVLHEKLYESRSLENIGIRSYVDELIYFIKLSYSTQQKEIKIHSQIDDSELSLANALPFSLLLNELITNSYKHAFKEKTTVNIFLLFTRKSGESFFHFIDDGCGFDYSNETKENTLGLNLIEAFSKQLKGEMSFTTKQGEGTEFTLHFKQ